MNGDRAEVKNAADPKQVKGAKQRERRREARFFDALARCMNGQGTTADFAVVMFEHDRGLLARGGIYRSTFNPSGSVMYYNVGRQDFAREIQALLINADEDAYAKLEALARQLARRDANETDAAHTDAAEESST